eukprot:3931746-Rhodomonas_salina.1
MGSMVVDLEPRGRRHAQPQLAPLHLHSSSLTRAPSPLLLQAELGYQALVPAGGTGCAAVNLRVSLTERGSLTTIMRRDTLTSHTESQGKHQHGPGYRNDGSAGGDEPRQLTR